MLSRRDALRLESYGFPALATEHRTTLTLADLNGCRWIILLQRRGEEQTLAGVDVRGELLRLGWAGTLTSIVSPFPDLEEAEQAFPGEAFGPFLASLVLYAHTQELAGERKASVQSDHQPTIQEKGGLRTIAAGEVSSWRR
jgi:hypothetical protein